VAVCNGYRTLPETWLRLPARPGIRLAQSQMINQGHGPQPQRAGGLQTFQHATAAACRLRRTAGQARLDDLAVRAEKLPGRTLLTLT
jgi:hypothetical protein